MDISYLGKPSSDYKPSSIWRSSKSPTINSFSESGKFGQRPEQMVVEEEEGITLSDAKIKKIAGEIVAMEKRFPSNVEQLQVISYPERNPSTTTRQQIQLQTSPSVLEISNIKGAQSWISPSSMTTTFQQQQQQLSRGPSIALTNIPIVRTVDEEMQFLGLLDGPEFKTRKQLNTDRNPISIIKDMYLGALIGDALGGPWRFLTAAQVQSNLNRGDRGNASDDAKLLVKSGGILNYLSVCERGESKITPTAKCVDNSQYYTITGDEGLITFDGARMSVELMQSLIADNGAYHMGTALRRYSIYLQSGKKSDNDLCKYFYSKRVPDEEEEVLMTTMCSRLAGLEDKLEEFRTISLYDASSMFVDVDQYPLNSAMARSVALGVNGALWVVHYPNKLGIIFRDVYISASNDSMITNNHQITKDASGTLALLYTMGCARQVEKQSGLGNRVERIINYVSRYYTRETKNKLAIKRALDRDEPSIPHPFYWSRANHTLEMGLYGLLLFRDHYKLNPNMSRDRINRLVSDCVWKVIKKGGDTAINASIALALICAFFSSQSQTIIPQPWMNAPITLHKMLSTDLTDDSNLVTILNENIVDAHQQMGSVEEIRTSRNLHHNTQTRSQQPIIFRDGYTKLPF